MRENTSDLLETDAFLLATNIIQQKWALWCSTCLFSNIAFAWRQLFLITILVKGVWPLLYFDVYFSLFFCFPKLAHIASRNLSPSDRLNSIVNHFQKNLTKNRETSNILPLLFLSVNRFTRDRGAKFDYQLYPAKNQLRRRHFPLIFF